MSQEWELLHSDDDGAVWIKRSEGTGMLRIRKVTISGEVPTEQTILLNREELTQLVRVVDR